LLIRGAKYSWGAEIHLDNVSIGCVDDLEMRKTFHKIERPITNGIQMTTRSYVIVSDAHIALAKVWIDRCGKTLASCSMVSTTQAERPSRLLYVGVEPPFDDICLKVVEPGTSIPRYPTLSYVWGHSKVYKLSLTTIDVMKKKIDMKLLPKTIMHAIWLTRRLGICYIWIDSLCIMQDSKDDWAQESAKMGVYTQIRTVRLRLGTL